MERIMPPFRHDRQRLYINLVLLCFFTACTPTLPGAESLSTPNQPPQPLLSHEKKAQYASARAARIALGHTNESQAAYRDLFARYPDDCTTALHLAATSWTPRYQTHVAACLHDNNDDDDDKTESAADDKYRTFRQYLLAANYSTYHANAVLGVDRHNESLALPLCPIYVTPAAAGTLSRHQVDYGLTQTSSLECLIALFLLGAAVLQSRLVDVLGFDFVRLARSLSVLYPSEVDPTRLVATVQIFPVQLATAEAEATGGLHAANDTPLYIMTDWHPRVLSQTRVGEKGQHEEEAVMYLGPDSIGLVQHFWYHHSCTIKQHDQPTRILDLCTGSGIQALYGLAQSKQACATCVDISSRALNFVLVNALLNDMDPERLQLVQGDLVSNKARIWSLTRRRKSFKLCPGEERPLLQILLDSGPMDIVTANPPFLPVPPALTHRHGKFSDGGGSGEEVLRAILGIAAKILQPKGVLAVVSEFFLAPQRNQHGSKNDSSTAWTADLLLERIKTWCSEYDDTHEQKEKGDVAGFLVTNEFPIDRHTYATRRADCLEEYHVWMDHLENMNMEAASPGFLYLRKGCKGPSEIKNSIAPRSTRGSLWTPSNPDAVTFTGHVLKTLYNM